MSVYSRIPIMYHPTNVVLLDDDKKFLTDVSLILADTIPYVVDDDPTAILEYLRQHTYNRNVLSSLVTKQVFAGEQANELSTSETFVIDFSRLQQNLAAPDRFKISTVGLIDRMMKKTDGLTFCQNIRTENIFLKTILFTGQTEAKEVIQAFNQKVIDGYLVKEGLPRQLAERINSTIFEQTWQLFIELGDVLTGLLAHILAPLTNASFISMFEQVRATNKTVEFYLLDSSCSFLLIDAAGQTKQLFVRNETDFNDCYEIAKDSQAPYDVLQTLRARQMFPYTIRSVGYANFESEEWEAPMVTMQQIANTELYYAVVDRPGLDVYSFEHYLKQEWPRA